MASIGMVDEWGEWQRVGATNELVSTWQEWSVIGKPLPPPEFDDMRWECVVVYGPNEWGGDDTYLYEPWEPALTLAESIARDNGQAPLW